MAKKHIPTNGLGDASENKLLEYKSKPKPYIQSQLITDYILARDRVLFKICDENTKQQLLEKYGKI